MAVGGHRPATGAGSRACTGALEALRAGAIVLAVHDHGRATIETATTALTAIEPMSPYRVNSLGQQVSAAD